MFKYYVLTATAALIFFGLKFLLETFVKANEKKKAWIGKGFSLLLAVVFSLRYLSGRIALVDTRGLNLFSPFGIDGKAMALTAFSTLTTWATFAAYTLLITYPFFISF